MAPPEAPGAGEPRDFAGRAATGLEELTPVWPRPRGTCGMDDLRARRAELEADAGRPDLWDDADRARAVTTELGRVADDVDRFDTSAGRPRRRAGAARAGRRGSGRRRARRGLGQGAGRDRRPTSAGGSAGSSCSRCSPASTTTGDAICEVHAGAGGTDAQDWAEMMLRMYQRWAERRGFTVEVDEATEGQEAGLLSATFIVRGRFAYGLLATERGVHRLVRMSPFDSQQPPPDELRLPRRRPVPGGVSDEVDIDEKDLRDRHLPLVGRRRPARQQDRLGRPAHAPPDRDRRLVPERAQPAPEQGQGDAGPGGQAGRASARGAAGRARLAQRGPGATTPGGTRSGRTCSPRTSWSRISGPRSRPGTSTPCSTATSTSSWRPSCAASGAGDAWSSRRPSCAASAVAPAGASAAPVRLVPAGWHLSAGLDR